MSVALLLARTPPPPPATGAHRAPLQPGIERRYSLENSRLGEVVEAVKRWPEFAETAGVEADWRERIRAAHRLEFRD